MKTNHWAPRLLSAKSLTCISLFLTLTAKAQWSPNGPPTVVEAQVIITGGITYYRLIGLLDGYCCQHIAGYDVTRQGSLLSQTVQDELWYFQCADMICDPWHEEWVSVLGALSPGSYTLTLSAQGQGPFPGPAPWAWVTLTVPTNSGPRLTVSTTTNATNPLLLIHVEGVSNVTYVVQSSANFTNWTAIKTNLGAPFTFSTPVTNGPSQFYRAAISQAPSRRL